MRLGLRKPREFALAPLSETELSQLAAPGTRLKTGIRRTAGAPRPGFRNVGNHVRGHPHLAYGDPFPGFPRHARGVRQFLGRRGQRLGARRHATSPVLTPAAACSTTATSGAPPYSPGSITVEYEPASDAPRRTRSRRSRSAPFPTRRAPRWMPPPARRIPRISANSTPTAIPTGTGSMSSVAQISFVDSGVEYPLLRFAGLHARQQLQALFADRRPLHQQRGRRAHRRGLLDLPDSGLRRRAARPAATRVRNPRWART